MRGFVLQRSVSQGRSEQHGVPKELSADKALCRHYRQMERNFWGKKVQPVRDRALQSNARNFLRELRRFKSSHHKAIPRLTVRQSGYCFGGDAGICSVWLKLISPVQRRNFLRVPCTALHCLHYHAGAGKQFTGLFAFPPVQIPAY